MTGAVQAMQAQLLLQLLRGWWWWRAVCRPTDPAAPGPPTLWQHPCWQRGASDCEAPERVSRCGQVHHLAPRAAAQVCDTVFNMHLQHGASIVPWPLLPIMVFSVARRGLCRIIRSIKYRCKGHIQGAPLGELTWQ